MQFEIAQAKQDRATSSKLDSADKVYQMLNQLASEPLHVPVFPDLAAFDVDGPEFNCVKIAEDGFCYPIKGMSDRLHSVISRAEEFGPYSPLGKSLRNCAEIWLDALKSIDPSNDEAILRLHLAPSILLGEEGPVEEEVKNGRRYIHFPTAVINHGPGIALDVVVRIESESTAIKFDSDEELILGTLQRGETRYPIFKFWQGDDAPITVKVVVTFWDFTKEDRGREESEPFQWPGFMHYVQGPISNPFVIGRPVAIKSELETVFRGRTWQLNKLCELVQQEQGMLLFVRGLRRVGKTSLILQFREKIREKGFPVVYVDCDLLEKQITLTNATWGEVDFLHQVAIIAAAVAGIDREPEEFAPNPTQAHIQFRNFLQSIATNNKGVILAFDETDYFGKGKFADFAPAVLDLLADLTRQKISSVFVHELTDGFWNEPRKIPNYFGIRVGLLNRDQTRLLATSKLVESDKIARLDVLDSDAKSRALNEMPSLIFTPLAFEYLWLVTGGYPFITQLICHYLLESKISSPQKSDGKFNAVVEVEDVRRIVQQIVMSEDDLAQIEYLSLGFGDDEKQLLLQIGQIDNSSYRDIEPRDGLLNFLRLARDGTSMQLREKYAEESAEDYAKFRDKYNKDSTWTAIRRLKQKRVIVGYDDIEDEQDEQDFSESKDRDGQANAYGRQGSKQMNSNLRLRVGFLWLYLRSSPSEAVTAGDSAE